jgi:hypothetical protein
MRPPFVLYYYIRDLEYRQANEEFISLSSMILLLPNAKSPFPIIPFALNLLRRLLLLVRLHQYALCFFCADSGEITQDDYDNWRYNYPKLEAERFKAKIDERRAQRKEPKPTEE